MQRQPRGERLRQAVGPKRHFARDATYFGDDTDRVSDRNTPRPPRYFAYQRREPHRGPNATPSDRGTEEGERRGEPQCSHRYDSPCTRPSVLSCSRKSSTSAAICSIDAAYSTAMVSAM